MTLRYLASSLRQSLRNQGVAATSRLGTRYLAHKWFPTDFNQTEHRFHLSQDLARNFSNQIAYGPFAGTLLSNASWWSGGDRGAMLLGLYEKEVLEWLVTNSSGRRVLVDIGAADGYYAVGGVARGYFSTSFCFETSDEGKLAIRENARANGILDHVHVLGHADEAQLIRLLDAESLHVDDLVILIDIEGGEFEMLTDSLLEMLAGAAIVVELHDWVPPESNPVAELAARAARWHTVGYLRTGERNPRQFAELRSWPDDDCWLICSEGRRHAMRWMVLTPLDGTQDGF